MRALITGVGGFAGRHLAEHCAARGAAVTGLGRRRPEELKGIDCLGDYLLADLLDAAATTRAIEEAAPDLVFHLAAEHDTPGELIAATRAAAAGEYHLTPGMLALLLDWHRVRRQPREQRARRRDRDLLELLAAGATTNAIAAKLGIAPKTVRNRSSLLYRRLGVRSRAEAAALAEERGLLD